MKNQLGFSLIEVMVAVAITSGLALTIARLMESSSQNVKQIEAKSESINLKGIVQGTLNNPTACSNTFGPVMTPANVATLSGSSTASVIVPNIKDKTNAIKYSSTSTDVLPLIIGPISVTNYNAGTNTGDLVIQSSFKKSPTITVDVKPIKIPINFSYTGAVLTACSTMAVGGEWLLGGNAGTVDGTDYVGTSDGVPLTFRVNTQLAGRVDHLRENAFLGYQAGSQSSALGQRYNTAVGHQALQSITSGQRNVAVGYQALNLNTGGYRNIAIGDETLFNTTTNGNDNIGMGYLTLRDNTTGSSNLALGNYAMQSNTTGNSNTALGSGSLITNLTGMRNVAVGISNLRLNTSGGNNVAVGYQSLWSNTTGSANLALGYQALWGNTTGGNNNAMGWTALYSNTTGMENIAIGDGALYRNTIGTYNLAMGYHALYNNDSTVSTEASNNVALGAVAGAANTIGSFNTYVGSFAGNMGTTATRTTAIGAYALSGANTGTENLAVGYRALSANTTGSENTAIGSNSLINSTGSGNIAIGPNSGSVLTSGSNNIIIGANAGTGMVSISNRLYLDSTAAATPLIGADFGVARLVTITGSLTVTGTFSNPSDRKLKENIYPLEDSLQKLSQINGVSYQMKDRKDKNKKEMGVIAQDVEVAYPELVSSFTHTDGKKYSAVSYSGLIAPIIEAIKELYGMIMKLVSSDKKQEQELRELKEKNEELTIQIKQLQESFEAKKKADP